jgi:ElaA protein
MNWHYKHFDRLTTGELYALLRLRSKVFVVEQNCPYQDMDNKDLNAVHLWYSDDNGTVLACCRLLPEGISYTEASIGRVATDPGARGRNLGRELMEKAIQYISEHWQAPAIRIGAQLYLKRFYESLSFVQAGDTYLEDGIPHIEMLLQAR